MREYVVDTGKVRLSVRDHPGAGPPLVCLHGLASNARWWDLVARRLSPAQRVVAVDLRGHGLSDKPDTGYSFEEVVGDLLGLHRALELPPAIWVGHSWGASVALSMAVAHPDLTVGVVCIDGGVGDIAAYFGESWEVAEAAMRPPDLSGVTETQLRSYVAGSVLVEGSDLDTAMGILGGNFEEFEPGHLRPRLRLSRHMEIARNLYHLDTKALLAAVDRPVVIVLAAIDEDVMASKLEGATDALRLLAGHGEVLWVDGGHDLPVQRPDDVANAIASLVQRV